MPAQKMIPGAYATKIAKKCQPTIYQEIGFSRSNDDWKYDIPCEINLGPFKLPTQPVVYYYIRQDDDYYYVCYCFYHWMDYTHCPPGKVFGGEHRSDFEGAIIRVPRFNPDGREPDHPEHKYITVCHDKFLSSAKAYRSVWIEFGGHGVHPGLYDGSNAGIEIFRYVRLINMDRLGKKYWQIIEKDFNKTGVHLPWQWSDNGKYAGWFWDRPDELFKAYFN